jgi:hypothetical protein
MNDQEERVNVGATSNSVMLSIGDKVASLLPQEAIQLGNQLIGLGFLVSMPIEAQQGMLDQKKADLPKVVLSS